MSNFKDGTFLKCRWLWAMCLHTVIGIRMSLRAMRSLVNIAASVFNGAAALRYLMFLIFPAWIWGSTHACNNGMLVDRYREHLCACH